MHRAGSLQFGRSDLYNTKWVKFVDAWTLHLGLHPLKPKCAKRPHILEIFSSLIKRSQYECSFNNRTNATTSC